MLKEVMKVVVLAAASAVTVPYMVALMANALYGWPSGPNKYKRALSPRKVLALNYSVLQKLEYLRFARLYFRWKKFYREAMVMRLLKDIPFGSHENKLDLYFPRQTAATMKQTLPQPVVVFVYGGAWGSGDKSMYGLLGSQIADNLNAIVCIPNYSIFPRGYVDDMVQDIVDCLSWVHSNIDRYGGDKECIMIVGHSAGGHLAVMATIELTLKRLMHNPQAIIRPDGDVTPPPAALTESFQFSTPGGSTPLSLSFRAPQPGSSVVESIRFEDRHFDGSSQSGSDPGDIGLPATPPRLPGVGPESASTTGSFFFVSEGDKDRRLSASGGSDSFFLVKSGNDNGNNGGSQAGSGTRSEAASDPPEDFNVSGDASQESKDSEDTEKEVEREDVPVLESKVEASSQGDDTQPKVGETVPIQLEISQSETVKEPEVAPVVPTKEPEVPAPPPRTKSPMELVIEDDDAMTRSQRSVRDLLHSIRCLIGLAGVYDIVDHFEHESMRGVEDVSSMGKAMYGPEHFHRFSPTQILATLPHRTRFPPVLLVHGDTDYVVPVTSTERFAAAVADMGSQVVEYHVPGCPHYDICLDLMDPQRAYHDIIMGVLRQAALTYAK